ncbi:MAG: hypothetical protein ACRC23_01790 [Aeromonas jandaei]
MKCTGNNVNIIDKEGYLVASISLEDYSVIIDESKYKIATNEIIKIRGDVK